MANIKWLDNPRQIIVDVEKNLADKLTQLTLSIHNNAVALSPVDTGTYRRAHHISHGSPSRAFNGATSIRINAGDYRPIYIQNNLPYVLRIEHGWSKQAPTGVYVNALTSAMGGL